MKKHATPRKTAGLWVVCAVAWLFASTVAGAPGGQLATASHPRMQATKTASIARDVALQPGGTLQGTVVDNAGMPQANYEVWIALDNSVQTVKTRTDAGGRFVATGISPGFCTIDTPCGGGKFRLWEAKDAPRDAQTSVLLVVCAKPAG